MQRVCRPGGKIMLEVWATSEPKFVKSKSVDENLSEAYQQNDNDKMVSFENRNKQRYERFYHFFDRSEFRSLTEVEGKGKRMEGEIYLECENWIFIGNCVGT